MTACTERHSAAVARSLVGEGQKGVPEEGTGRHPAARATGLLAGPRGTSKEGTARHPAAPATGPAGWGRKGSPREDTV